MQAEIEKMPSNAKHPMQVSKLEFELAWMEFNYRYCTLTV